MSATQPEEPTSRRGSDRSEATRSALIDLAVELFSTRGYAETSMRDIAREGPVSMGAIYAALGRLEDKGFVRSVMGEATAQRGGKPKRLFRVTPVGVKTARELHQVRERIWNAIAEGRRA